MAHNGLSAARAEGAAREEVVDGMPRRAIGREGDMISVIGYPGLALARGEQPECNDALHRAFDRGINYYDVAPAYGKGEAEIKMGIGLQGLDRDSIFLACKTKMRDKDGAREGLERSLERLKRVSNAYATGPLDGVWMRKPEGFAKAIARRKAGRDGRCSVQIRRSIDLWTLAYSLSEANQREAGYAGSPLCHNVQSLGKRQ